MQTITDCLPPNVSALTPLQATVPTERRALTPTASRTLWVRMAEIYGHRWTSAYGDDPDADGAAGTWAKGLSGVTGTQLADGLKACVVASDPWPPTLPAFRAMCLGVPSLPSVRLDRERVTPFARLVWSYLDGYAMRHAASDKAERMFRDAYELAREHVMAGGDLPEDSSGAIEHVEPVPTVPKTREEREAHLERVRESMRLSGSEAEHLGALYGNKA